MGRRSIPIEEIQDERKRQVTFQKRKTGLFKKAMELSILCKSNILLVVFDENENLTQYCSSQDPRPVLRKYFGVAHYRHERYCDEDYDTLYANSKKNGTEPRLKHIPPKANPPMEMLEMGNGQGVVSNVGQIPVHHGQFEVPQHPNMNVVEQGGLHIVPQHPSHPPPPNIPVMNPNHPVNPVYNVPQYQMGVIPRPSEMSQVTSLNPPRQGSTISNIPGVSEESPEKKESHPTSFPHLQPHPNFAYLQGTGFTPLPFPPNMEEVKAREEQMRQMNENRRREEEIRMREDEENRRRGHIIFEAPNQSQVDLLIHPSSNQMNEEQIRRRTSIESIIPFGTAGDGTASPHSFQEGRDDPVEEDEKKKNDLLW